MPRKSELTLATVLSMSPEQCYAVVRALGITDPHPYQQGDLSDPTYRMWVRAQRAK